MQIQAELTWLALMSGPEAVRRITTTPRELLDTLGHYVVLKQVSLFMLLSRKLEMHVCTLAGLWGFPTHNKQDGEGRLLAEEDTCCQNRLLASTTLSHEAPRPQDDRQQQCDFRGPSLALMDPLHIWLKLVQAEGTSKWCHQRSFECVLTLLPPFPLPFRFAFMALFWCFFLVC